MKILIVGLGIQGKKRKKLIKKNFFFASVDIKNKKADFNNIEDVPLNKYDTVFICTPDNVKLKIINYCLKYKKNILVEKPLIAKSNKILKQLQVRANNAKVILYTAYNHRFEPHFINIKKIIKSKVLGKIYYCYLFYGNGTAKEIKKNQWRDEGLGVVADLGPHLIDTINFWFNKKIKFKPVIYNKFENNSPDHAILQSKQKNFFLNLEMSVCMWKNTLRCDIIGSKGSLHLNSLCKWGPSILKLRKRTLPSGLPNEKKFIIKSKDPTWKLEHDYFYNLVKSKKKNNLKNDILINKTLKSLT